MGKGKGTGEGWGEGEGKGKGQGGNWKGGLCSSCDFTPKCKYSISIFFTLYIIFTFNVEIFVILYDILTQTILIP